MSESIQVSAISPQSIFLEHQNWLRTVVRSRLNEPDAVEDVMQNIALAIVRQQPSLQEISRLSAWLYQIAVRQVLMYRRTSGRRRRMLSRVGQHVAQQSEAESAVPPIERIIAAETAENVRQALTRLGELDRQILLLKYTENWSYRQLAEHLGVREDTVEYRLLKARKHLKSLLGRSSSQEQLPC